MFNLDAAGNILKVRYLGPIREQLNGATILMSRIMRDERMVDASGKTWTISLHVGRNESAGVGRADGGPLPTAGQQGYATAVIPNAYIYGRIQVTGPTIRAARDNAGAFVTAVESEIQGCTRDTKKTVNRQLHSNGVDPVAFYKTGAGATALTCDDGETYVGGVSGTGNAFVHLPSAGTMSCDLLDASNSYAVLTSADVLTLGAKNANDYDVTAATAISASAADGDVFVQTGTKGNQMMGIRGIISASDPPLASLENLAVASNGWWKAQEFAATSSIKRDLTLALMQEPLSAIAVNSDYDESDVSFLLSNYQLRDKYVSLLVQDKRFVDTMKLDGGFTGVSFNGIPLVPDAQCRRNTIYYVVPASLRIFRSSDFDWMDKDGAVLHAVAGYDAYEAVLFHYGNLATIARNANAVLLDLNE